MTPRLPAAVAAAALLLTACSSADDTDHTADVARTPGPSTSTPAAPVEPVASAPADDPAEVLVHGPGARLVRTGVRRDGDDYDVTALWQVPPAKGRHDYVLAESDDGFASGDYRVVSQAEGLAALEPRPTDLGSDPGLDGLVTPLVSLVPGTEAGIGSPDGATISWFDTAARSTDAGTTWTTFDLPAVDARRAQFSGAVVLSDGRLLALLSGFEDETLTGPAERPHGFYASPDDDWTRTALLDTTFAPALPAGDDPVTSVGAGGDGDEVVWATTTDDRLYVSADEAATFTEVPAR